MTSVAGDFYDFIVVDEKHLGILVSSLMIGETSPLHSKFPQSNTISVRYENSATLSVRSSPSYYR